MGSGNSRMGSGSHSRTRPEKRRWEKVKRTVSSVLLCGASSRSPNEVEDYPAQLLVNSTVHCHQEKLKFPRTTSDLSLSSSADLISTNSENGLSNESGFAASKNTAAEVGPSNVEPAGKGKGLSLSRELVPSPQVVSNSRSNQIASTSYQDQPSLDCVSANEVVGMDAANLVNNTSGDLSQVGGRASNSNSLFSRGPRESLSDGVSVENNLSESIDFSNVDYESSHGPDSGPDSHVGFHTLRHDTLQDVIPPGLGFLVSEREQNQQDGSLLQVDVLGISSNILSGNSAELSSRNIRRNSRRLFWDAFSRRSSRRHTDSRTFIFSPDSSDNLRSHDRWLLDFDGDLLNDDVGVDFRSHESRTRGGNEHQWNSRSEIWERLRGDLESTDHRTAACPRGIHADGRCLCQSSLSAVESGARAGISRIVMLAETLFEVLDQIHRQPMTLSLPMVSLPAPESIVDSFPVKTHTKTEKMECADDVSQCYICLSEYEEGDKIRVLPCHHEYHSPCVDKWLKEIHGVCPLCRRDVRHGLAETHVQIE